jgi:hypothetical protein
MSEPLNRARQIRQFGVDIVTMIDHSAAGIGGDCDAPSVPDSAAIIDGRRDIVRPRRR